MTKATTKTTTTRRAIEAAKIVSEPTAPDANVKRQRDKAAIRGQTTIPASMDSTPSEPPTGSPDSAAPSKPPRQTKAALLRARLAEPGGVSLAVLIEATGWQAHTLRAALSGLRKEGLTLTRRRDGEDTIYAIDPSGATAAAIVDDSAEQKTEAAGVVANAIPEAGSATQDASMYVNDAASVTLPAETNA